MANVRVTHRVLLLQAALCVAAVGARAQADAPPPPPPPAPAATAPAAPEATTAAPASAVADGGPAAPQESGTPDAGAAAVDAGVPTTAVPPRKPRPVPGPPPGRTRTEPLYPMPPTWEGELTEVSEDDAAEYSRVVDEFGESAADVRREISDLVQAQYRERRARLKDEYETRIQAMEREEARRRLAAIEKFERFLQKYPNDPTYTPDAVFRLAELYFEQATEEYQSALRKFDEDIQAFERGELKLEPVQPEHHYEKTILLYQRLITEFPGHKNLDGAHYLLGYCLDEQGESDQAIVQFLELTRRFPSSRFYSESWMRVGEYYFDNDKLPEAIAAYEHVLETPESPYFDKALYKLGWSYYRMNQYEPAIARFLQVLDYSEQKKSETGTEGSDLVPESLQYIAVSLSDDNWDRGIGYDPFQDENGEKMVGFAQEYFKKLQGRVYERDVFVRLGDILFDASKYPGAVMAYNWVLELAPLHPDAPNQADRIVQSWERQRDFEKSSRAREMLVKNFSEGTPWYNANKENIEALRTAQTLARASLYTAAVFHHQQAQKFQSQDKFDLAKVEFEQAANGYREYLKRFPRDRDSYELRWYLSDTLYNSLQFREAATEYTKVRESNEGTKHRAEAALNVYFALMKVVEQEEASGALPKKRPMTSGEGVPPQEGIPPLKVELIDACDRFVERSPDNALVPAVKATAAEIYYIYGHFDEARPRLEEVMEKYSDSDAAKVAAGYIMQFLLAKKDWEQVEKFAQYVQQRKVGDQGEYRTLELGALFQKAKLYMDEGENFIGQGKATKGNRRLEQAASEYIRLVDQNKDHEYADKALFNAALAYKKSGRFDSALKLYERVYREYDKSDLAPTALSEVADSAYSSYDFEKAIETYLLLVKKYPESPRRADAQYNAALTLENLQRYDQAAREYENYAKLFPKRDDAAAVFYRAALVQERRGDTKAYVGTLNRFLDKYKKDPAQTDMVVEAYSRLADVSLAAGKQKDAERLFEATADEFERRKGAAASPAGYQAARARFLLAEFALKKYESMKIEGKSTEQVKALQKKSEELKKMEKLYQEVLPYKQLDWALATAYRLGYLYENLAESVLSSPCPKDVQRVGEEACDEYRILLEDRFAAPLEQKASAAYQAAVDRAKEAKVQNEWTRRALEGLKKYQKDLQVDKEPKRRMVGAQYPGIDVALPADEAGEQKSLKGK